ncbi:MAG: NUDIX hydrolase [Lachnospiraceae bacterium]|nr:NUDIX hydrolase [Lachnospiraceae bacterium]
MSEIVDIYDRNKNKTGETIDREAMLKPGQYKMIVIALVENMEGKFLVSKRALDKKWAAGQWEVPGGGSMAGETSFEAITREVREETGLDVSGCEPHIADYYFNDDPVEGDNYFTDIYHLKLDFSIEDVTPDEKETLGAELVAREDLEKLNNEEGFLHFDRINTALKKDEERGYL